ncbi:MAG TPA: GNAT family N-acetyltransferase [Thermoguttaceae bacterium]|nr:GNAT family N-acetyltransferase [Thermoguttaceae bacterium]
MKTIPVRTTYLEMNSRPADNTRPADDGIAIVHAQRPTVAFYRFLYEGVGRDFQWVDRTMISDETLRAIIGDDRVEVHVLYADGTPAGYAELDRREDGQIELAYFGLMPEFRGKGLGRYLLNWAVHKAWSYEPKRFWVHTCELDHPAALPTYLEAGFAIYDEQILDQPMP